MVVGSGNIAMFRKYMCRQLWLQHGLIEKNSAESKIMFTLKYKFDFKLIKGNQNFWVSPRNMYLNTFIISRFHHNNLLPSDDNLYKSLFILRKNTIAFVKFDNSN